MELAISPGAFQLTEAESFVTVVHKFTPMPTVRYPTSATVEAKHHIIAHLSTDRAGHFVWEMNHEPSVPATKRYIHMSARLGPKAMVTFLLPLHWIPRVMPRHHDVPDVSVNSRHRDAAPKSNLPQRVSLSPEALDLPDLGIAYRHHALPSYEMLSSRYDTHPYQYSQRFALILAIVRVGRAIQRSHPHSRTRYHALSRVILL